MQEQLGLIGCFVWFTLMANGCRTTNHVRDQTRCMNDDTWRFVFVAFAVQGKKG